MGLFNSTTAKQDTRSASDQAKIFGHGNVSETGSLQVGEKSRYLEQGSLFNSGKINSGVDLGGAKVLGGITVSDAGAAGVASSLADTIKSLLSIPPSPPSSPAAAASPLPLAPIDTPSDQPADDQAPAGAGVDWKKWGLVIVAGVVLYWLAKRRMRA